MWLDTLLDELNARLPELEWKLGQVDVFQLEKSLPKGLFQSARSKSSKAYIKEIQTDIQFLAAQTDLNTAKFIAERIRNKIHLLVSICQLHKSNQDPSVEQTFMTRIVTRQQKLLEMQEKIAELEVQKQALLKTFEAAKEPSSQLALQAEIGKIERLLTLSQETLTTLS